MMLTMMLMMTMIMIMMAGVVESEAYHNDYDLDDNNHDDIWNNS